MLGRLKWTYQRIFAFKFQMDSFNAIQPIIKFDRQYILLCLSIFFFKIVLCN